MDIIEEYDYIPNAFARGMGLRSLKTIGILCADSSDLFTAKAIYLLEQELQAESNMKSFCFIKSCLKNTQRTKFDVI